MFNRKTLFIIGAGAGFDVDLPVGRKLAEDIANRVKVGVDHGHLSKHTVDPDLALNFFERNDPKANAFLQAFNRIRDGVLLSNSIDDFLNIHEDSPEIVAVGKAAIVRAILHAERRSKLYVDPSNIYNKLDISNIRDSWFVKFMQVLTPNRKVPNFEHVLENVSFIVFNYDRCLEHFLTHSLHLAYGMEKNKSAEIVRAAQIIHPYGWVGALDQVPFGGHDEMRMDYRVLSTQIKTYTERVEEETTVFSMQEAIREAECVVFLGFAYHKQNMRLLFRQHTLPKLTKPVFGTALHMSDADVGEIQGQLQDLFPEIDPDEDNSDENVFRIGGVRVSSLRSNEHISIENKLSCAQLFDYYGKSLAG